MKFNDTKAIATINEALYVAMRPAYAETMTYMKRHGYDVKDLFTSSVTKAVIDKSVAA